MAAYKAVAVKATIDFSGQNLAIFKDYRQLDPSEKVNLSYWIGMVFTALLAKELLEVKQLLHASCLNPQRMVMTNSSSRSLADLVGRDSHLKWHVLEAKGRQGKPTQPERRKWKAQANTIDLIGGRTPETRSFCIAKIGSVLSAELVDPDGDAGTYEIMFPSQGEDIVLIEAYYGALRDVLAQSSFQISRSNMSFTLTRIAYDAVEQRHVFIGMESNCYNRILEKELPSDILPVKGDDFYLSADGIIVLTSVKCDPISN